MAHYSLGQRPLLLASWAKKAATQLRKTLEKEFGPDARPIFVYRGMSGIAHATALSLEWERRSRSWMRQLPGSFAYVRKPNEKSHGCEVEFEIAPNLDNAPIIPVFVDDFVSSGETRVRTMRAFHMQAPYRLMASDFMNISQVRFIQAIATSDSRSDEAFVSVQSWETMKSSFPA